MCGKKLYETYKHAAHDAHEVSRKHDETATQVYRCRDCQGWHVGSRVLARMRKPPRQPPPYDMDGLDS